MGHAGAIISGGTGQAKLSSFRENMVCENLGEIGQIS